MSTILDIINGALGLLNKIMGMFQRKQDRDAGAQAQDNVLLKAENKDLANVAKAGVDTTDAVVDDRLQHGNF